MERLEQLRKRVEETEKALRDDFDRQAIAQARERQKNASQAAERQETPKPSGGSKRQCPSLYLILTIGPGGPKFSDIRFSIIKPNPAAYTRGEGQCLVFKLNNYDCSTAFADALYEGKIYDDLKNKIFEFDFDHTKRRDPMKQLDALDEKLSKIKSDGD